MSKALIPLSRLIVSKPGALGVKPVGATEDAVKAGIIPKGSFIKFEDDIWKVKSLEGDVALKDVITTAQGMFTRPNTKTVNMNYSGTRGSKSGGGKSSDAKVKPTNTLLGAPSTTGNTSPSLDAMRSSIGAIDPSNATMLAILKNSVPEAVWKDRYQFTSVDEYINYATAKYGKK